MGDDSNNMRRHQPWVSGPAELLEHADFLLCEDSPVRLRLALIAIDNAVELAIKTYLSLPKRVTKLTIPRKRVEEISESFPALLDALEEFATDKLEGIDLAAIEWYHRLRNQLYHQGYGLTVERRKVEIYAEVANLLFKKFFGDAPLSKRPTTELLGRFIELWLALESALQSIAWDNSLTGTRRSGGGLIQFLRSGNILPNDELEQAEKHYV